MLSDPRFGYGISWTVAGLSAAWLAGMAIDGDRIRDALGEAVFGISFLAFFALVAALIVAMLFRRLVCVRDALISGRGADARWRIGRADWQAFAGHAGADIRTDRNGILVMVAAIDVVICGGPAALMPRDALVIAWIGLGIAAVGGVGWLLGRRATANHLTYRGGEVILGERGMMVNGVLHVWGHVGARLDGVELIEDERPRRLAVTYSVVTRAGRQYQTVYAPVPDDMPDLARILCAPCHAATPHRPSGPTVHRP